MSDTKNKYITITFNENVNPQTFKLACDSFKYGRFFHPVKKNKETKQINLTASYEKRHDGSFKINSTDHVVESFREDSQYYIQTSIASADRDNCKTALKNEDALEVKPSSYTIKFDDKPITSKAFELH